MCAEPDLPFLPAQGPPRLQPDALADLDNRRVGDLLDLGNSSGQVEVDPWDAAERRDFAGRALRRLGFDAVLGEPGGPSIAGPHVLDTGVLFVRPRQRMVRRFLSDMRDRLSRVDGAADPRARSAANSTMSPYAMVCVNFR